MLFFLWKKVKKVKKILKKAKILYPLTLKELLAVKRLLRTSRTCVSTLQIAPIETWPSLYEHSIGLYFNKQFEDTLEKSILNEEEIADDASPELFLIRKKIKQATSCGDLHGYSSLAFYIPIGTRFKITEVYSHIPRVDKTVCIDAVFLDGPAKGRNVSVLFFREEICKLDYPDTMLKVNDEDIKK